MSKKMGMKKCIKSLAAICCMGVILWGNCMTLFAQSITEVESNNSMEEAQEIQCNRKTAQDFLNGNNKNEVGIKGYTSNTDEDWYKVYLTSDLDEYFSITYNNPVSFEIFDASGNTVFERTSVSTGKNPYAGYKLENIENGYYYIKIIGNTSYSRDYQFIVGNPTYRAKSTDITGQSVTLSRSNSPRTMNYSFEQVEVPLGALVYKIQINGITSFKVGDVEVGYGNSKNVLRGTGSNARFNVPLAYNYGLDKNYSVKYYYGSSASTFTPMLRFTYLYPLVEY